MDPALALIACLLMPLGLEHLALIPMGWGIDVTIVVAQWVAALPGNVWKMAEIADLGRDPDCARRLLAVPWQGRWRWWGPPVIVMGLATMLLTRPPDIVLGDLGRLLAVRAPDGDYYVAPTADKIHSFLQSDNGAHLLPWPKKGDNGDPLDCSAEGRCTYSAYGRRVALVTADSGLPVPCYTVDAIVAQVAGGFACKSQIPVADRIDSWRQGSIALWIDKDGIAIESANASRGDRPWVPHPVSRRERERAAETR